MALVDGLSFTQNTDIETGVVTDTSDYGVGGNPARSATANYLLWSKTDQNSNRTFLYPSQGNVLSTLTYTVSTTLDGYFEGILMRITPYDNGENYVEQQQSGSVITQYASIVAYNSLVYKCIAPSTGNLPTDTNFWEEVTLQELYTLLDNTNIHVFIEDFYIKVRSSACANEKFKANCGCGCNDDLNKIRPALNIRYKIISADSAFANGNPEQMDKIIRDVEATCANCN